MLYGNRILFELYIWIKLSVLVKIRGMGIIGSVKYIISKIEKDCGDIIVDFSLFYLLRDR